MAPEQLKEISRICPRWRDRPLAEIVAAVERVQAKPAAIAAHEAQPVTALSPDPDMSTTPYTLPPTIDQIMTLAQEFASCWAIFGSRFDQGDGKERAEESRQALKAAIASALSAQPSAGAWLPIETAPRDGTTVLLAAPSRVTAGEWRAEQWPTASEHHSSTGEYLGQYETGECIPAAWCSWDGGFTDENPPTYWMPTPAAPTPKEIK